MMLKNTLWLAAAGLFLVACGDDRGGSVVQWMNDGTTQLSVPATPSKIELYNPIKSPSKVTTPSLKISGVKSGLDVYIYKTAACTTAIKTARAAATTVNIKLPALANGNYKFYAKSKNSAGFSKCRGYVAYTVDTFAPAKPVVSSPLNNTFVDTTSTITGSCESGSTVNITGDIASASATCAAGSFSIPVTFTAAQGVKNISVSQTDAAGNTSQANSLSFTKDTIAPTVSIGAPSISSINTGNVDYPVTYTGASTIHLVTASVTVNTTGTVAFTKSIINGTTSTPTLRINVTGGNGTVDSVVIVAATSHDAAGNMDGGASQGASVTIDNIAPTVSIGTPGVSSITTGDIDYAVTYTGATNINLSSSSVIVATTGTVTYTKSVIGGLTSTPTLRIHVTGGNGTIDSVAINGGSSFDNAGNVDSGDIQGSDVTVDNTAPTVSIGAPSASSINTGDIDYAVTYTGASSINLVSANVVPGISGTVAYTKSILNGNTSSPTIRFHITGGDGSIDSVSINAGASQDNFGNADIGASQSTQVIVDNTSPTISLGTLGYINNSNQNTYTLEGTCNENGDTITITAPAAVNGTTTTCASGTFGFSNLDVHAIPDGTINFTVKIQDVVGNLTTDTKSATKDASVPSISSITLNNPATSPGIDPTPDIEVAGVFAATDMVQLFSDATCTTPISTAIPAPVMNDVIITSDVLITDATYTYFAKATDAAGNTSCSGVGINVSYTLDTTDPTINITSPMAYINNANKNAYTFNGTCSEDGQTITMTSPISTTTTCISGAFTFSNLDLSALTDGTKTFTVDISDVAGNSSSDSDTAIKDTIDPTISITSVPSIIPGNQNSYEISGTCTANGDTISITTPALGNTATCTSGTFTISSIDVSGVADGTVNFTLRNQDAAGNFATDSGSTTKDVTPPSNPSCDSMGGDATVTKSDTVTWTGSTDDTSGISHYEMHLIRPYTGEELISWTDIGSATDPYRFTSIAPKLKFSDVDNSEDQVNYRISIRAVDNFGNTSGEVDCPDWHLAPAYGNFRGLESTAPSDSNYLNQATPYALKFTKDKFNNNYFTHDTGANQEQIIINEDGNYQLSFVLPLTRVNGESTDHVASTNSIVKINGTTSPVGYAANSFTLGHHISVDGSNHMTVLLENLKKDDIITIETQNNADDTEPMKVPDGNLFTAYLEYIPDEQKVFTATSTTTNLGDINLNFDTESVHIWNDSIANPAYTHDPGDTKITFQESGDYLISINVPYIGTPDYNYQKIDTHIYIDGNDTNVDNYMDATNGIVSNLNGHQISSNNYTNVLRGINAGQVLEIHSIRAGEKADVNVVPGQVASVYIQKLNTNTKYEISLGESPPDWNTDAIIHWIKDFVIDGNFFEDINDAIIVDADGDYLVYVSDRITATSDYVSPITRLKVNGDFYPGAECSAHNTRKIFDASRIANCDMQILLQDLKKGDKITYTTEAGIAGGSAEGNYSKVTLRKVTE